MRISDWSSDVCSSDLVKSCASWPKGVIEMSRVAKKPIALPKGVELNVQAESVSVKGPKGTLSIAKSADIDVKIENGQAQLSTSDAEKVAITGTLRAIIPTMLHGVSDGIERKPEPGRGVGRGGVGP